MRLLNGETDAGPRSVDRLPPHLFFLGSAVFHYLGPSFAVLLFAIVPVGGVAWLRIVSAALVLAAGRGGHSGPSHHRPAGRSWPPARCSQP